MYMKEPEGGGRDRDAEIDTYIVYVKLTVSSSKIDSVSMAQFTVYVRGKMKLTELGR